MNTNSTQIGPIPGNSSNVYIGDVPPFYPNPTVFPFGTYPVPQNYIHYSYVPNEPHFPWKIRQVSNGFILCKNGIEYVFSDIKGILKFLEKDVKA